MTKLFNIKNNIMAYLLLACIVFVLFPMRISAQESTEGVARINNIVEGKDEYKKTTNRAQLKRDDQGDWLNVKKNDELYFDNILRLDKNIWLRINVKNRIQNGNIAISTNPDEVLKDINEQGKYKIIEDTDGTGEVAIELIHGIAVFNVIKNKIKTITNGLTSSVESGSTTRAFYSVHADGSGEIYLQQGHLTFPGNAEFTGLKVGQAATFKDGQITKVFFPDVAMASKYQEMIKYNNNTVWKRSFFKNPATWIGVAAVGIGTAVLIAKPWNNGNEVTGTVNVNWGN